MRGRTGRWNPAGDVEKDKSQCFYLQNIPHFPFHCLQFPFQDQGLISGSPWALQGRWHHLHCKETSSECSSGKPGMQTFCQVGNSVIKTFHLIRFSGGMILGWYWDENIWSHQLSLGCKLFVRDQNISSHRILSRCDNWKGFYLAIIKKWSYLVMILHELDNHPEVVGVVFDGNHLRLVLPYP